MSDSPAPRSELLCEALDATRLLVVVADVDGRVCSVNRAVLGATGLSEEACRRPLWELAAFPADRALLEAAFPFREGALPSSLLFPLMSASGSARVVDWDIRVFHDAQGAQWVVLSGIDLSERAQDPGALETSEARLRRLVDANDELLAQEQRARLETEIANARLFLLVEGSKRLSRTITVPDTLETLAEVVVPSLADWSYVVHRGWDDEGLQTAAAHEDPNQQELVSSLRGWRPEGEWPARATEVALYRDVKIDELALGEWPVLGTRQPEQLRVLRELGIRSALRVPIRGRRGTDAFLVLVSSVDPRRYDGDDVVLAQDLADRAAISLENGRLLAEALGAVRARDDFLAVAAHELRTPLTSLLLKIQTLRHALKRDPMRNEPAIRGIESAETYTRRLATLIDDLLDVSRLASNQLAIHVEECDLVLLLRNVLAGLAVDLQRAGCRVDVFAPERLTGWWDPVRIEQVLTNLLANAMKFGAGHPVDVNIEAIAPGVRIAIRDHGIGLAREDQARIFDRFERAVSVRHFGGLGLGLYISSQIVHAHHGSLRVESKLGEGACFIVELPRTLARFITPDDRPGSTISPRPSP